MIHWLRRMWVRWQFERQWGGKCSMHGFECPCDFHKHNPIGIEQAWWLPYRRSNV